ncbi:olfactory receptor 8U9-like [Lissotriton helveticus]
MQTGNRTLVTEFTLLGLTDDPALQVPLFVVFLFIYTITLIGNVGMMALIIMSPLLHTPMYLLLCNLSFVDICYSSVSTPKMLANFLAERKTISFVGCIIQMFLGYTTGCSEVFLVALMAYDRYTAICNPLLYSVIMNTNVCTYLLVSMYAVAILYALTQTIFSFNLPFCTSNIIPHFVCEAPAVLKITCADASLNEAVTISLAGCLIMISLIIILISYTYIVSAVLKINSLEGRWKAFSTRSSHFVCVIIMFGTLVFMYGQPNSSHSMAKDRVSSVFYLIIIPMLNPLVYSLRNRDVKEALRKVTKRI